MNAVSIYGLMYMTRLLAMYLQKLIIGLLNPGYNAEVQLLYYLFIDLTIEPVSRNSWTTHCICSSYSRDIEDLADGIGGSCLLSKKIPFAPFQSIQGAPQKNTDRTPWLNSGLRS